MFGVLSQLADDFVVVAVRIRAEGLLSLDDDHHRAVGIEFLEVGAHQLHRLHGRRVIGSHRRGMQLADYLELRGDHIHQDGDRDPEQDDRYREYAETMGHDGPFYVFGRSVRGIGHADFTRQYVWALTPLADCSSRTIPFTVTRHPIWSLSPCAMRLALTAGNVVDKVIDHGSGTVIRCTFASGSK